MGNHFIFDCAETVDDLQIAIECGLTMLHYPMRSLAHVRRKVINGGLAYEAMRTPGYGEHWRGNYAAYQREGEAAVVRIFHEFIRQNAAKEQLPIA
jgi:hypothetical protein